ncbi:hypothetical protein H6F77_16120 [Microcoleus sp. FACHB-831]|uniref:hypothetical protein n=1 Tax=Microcoleus sp. FACHB-831 TaxID=2692827 RepID=UPI0016823C80|nr:hypothetical protein [Microcoleus sp. FACHB-831]MBD1922596.1 hypothetical protein [Microcoleus sp. FACHB-831]
MNKNKIVKSIVVNGCLSLTLIGAISTPARAVTNASSDNFFTQLFGELNHQIESVRGYLDKIVADKLKPLSESLGKDLDSAISSATGVLGLPDPAQSRKDVEEIASAADSPVYGADKATNEVDRQITRGASDATLGLSGQQRLKEQASQTQNSVDIVQQQANAAQEEVVTQNVMKQIALQNARTGAILGSLRADSLQAAQRQELANLNLTNISRSVDAQNQAMQAEKVGTGFDTLRITSRARLF